MAFGAGAGWGGGWPLPRWTLCFLSDRTTPEPTFLTSALYQRHQHSRPARRRVCARTPVLVLPCVVRGVRARARPFLCTCYFQIALSPSFSSEKERCHVFTGLWSPLVGFPAPSTSPAPALSMLLRVRSYPLFQDPLLGVTDKGPGKTVDLSFQDDKLLFLFNL